MEEAFSEVPKSLSHVCHFNSGFSEKLIKNICRTLWVCGKAINSEILFIIHIFIWNCCTSGVSGFGTSCLVKGERWLRVWSLGKRGQIGLTKHWAAWWQEEIVHSEESVQHCFGYRAFREKIWQVLLPYPFFIEDNDNEVSWECKAISISVRAN